MRSPSRSSTTFDNIPIADLVAASYPPAKKRGPYKKRESLEVVNEGEEAPRPPR